MSDSSWWSKCTHSIVIFHTFLFLMTGVAMVCGAIFLLVLVEVKLFLVALFDTSADIIPRTAGVIMSIGVFVVLVGLCGLYGIVKESAFAMGIYICCLVMYTVGFVAVGIYSAVEKDSMVTTAGDNIRQSVRNYTGDGDSKIDFFQVKFHCCGPTNYIDYQQSVWFVDQLSMDSDRKYVPKTCCAGQGEDTATFQPNNYSLCNIEAQSLPKPWDTFIELQPRGCYNFLLQLLELMDDGKMSIFHGMMMCGYCIFEILNLALVISLCLKRTRNDDD